jgi:hypothetical protein
MYRFADLVLRPQAPPRQYSCILCGNEVAPGAFTLCAECRGYAKEPGPNPPRSAARESFAEPTREQLQMVNKDLALAAQKASEENDKLRAELGQLRHAALFNGKTGTLPIQVPFLVGSPSIHKADCPYCHKEFMVSVEMGRQAANRFEKDPYR